MPPSRTQRSSGNTGNDENKDYYRRAFFFLIHHRTRDLFFVTLSPIAMIYQTELRRDAETIQQARTIESNNLWQTTPPQRFSISSAQ
jgi:hypothetical protein